jgi:hypothetical protein
MVTRGSVDGVLRVLLIGNYMTLEDFLAHVPGHGSIKAHQPDGSRQSGSSMQDQKSNRADWHANQPVRVRDIPVH